MKNIKIPLPGAGIALKVSDGNQRAMVPTLLHVLRHFKYLPPDELAQLEALYPPYIFNHKGEHAAEIRVALPM